MSRFTGYYRPKAGTSYGYTASNLPVIGGLIRAKEEAKRWDDYRKRFPAVDRRGGILYKDARQGTALRGAIYEGIGMASRGVTMHRRSIADARQSARTAKTIYR